MPLRRNRRQYEQLTDFDRGRIIGLREAGWSNRRIGRHLGRSDMVVARCWQQWITEAISQGVTVWGAISWDTRSSLVVLQGTLTARRYVDDILTPIVLPMLSSRPVPFINRIMLVHILSDSPNNVFKDMTSYHGLPGHRSFANRACLRRWEGNCSRPRYRRELTAQMQRLWQDLPQGVIVI
ncbi:uncharacterized protein TNCV_2164931 [Trichonephila clavipes]|nr:uncharacterized protein TNCV_2164931 [Trichonephila clavipes]